MSPTLVNILDIFPREETNPTISFKFFCVLWSYIPIILFGSIHACSTWKKLRFESLTIEAHGDVPTFHSLKYPTSITFSLDLLFLPPLSSLLLQYNPMHFHQYHMIVILGFKVCIYRVDVKSMHVFLFSFHDANIWASCLNSFSL